MQVDAAAAPVLGESLFVNVWTATDPAALDELHGAMKTAEPIVAAQPAFVSLTLLVERNGLRLIAVGRWRDVDRVCRTHALDPIEPRDRVADVTGIR